MEILYKYYVMYDIYRGWKELIWTNFQMQKRVASIVQPGERSRWRLDFCGSGSRVVEKWKVVITHLSIEGVGHGERGRDPAIGVDGVRGQALNDAGDWITDVLGGRDDHGAREEEHRGEVVVQPEHHRVRRDFLPFQVLSETS